MNLPEAYLDYWENADGLAEGLLRCDPGYFQLWSLDEVEEMNKNLQVDSYAPGFIGFGSNGGGELLAFDADEAVYMIPFVPLSPEYAKKVANSWADFVDQIEVDEDEEPPK